MRQSAKRRMRKRRKAQNHHKYLMGGIVAKYFPECYQYEEKRTECDLVSGSCFGRVQAGGGKRKKGWRKNADEMEDEKDRNGGHADETKTKENSGGYANSKDFAGGSFFAGSVSSISGSMGSPQLWGAHR